MVPCTQWRPALTRVWASRFYWILVNPNSFFSYGNCPPQWGTGFR